MRYSNEVVGKVRKTIEDIYPGSCIVPGTSVIADELGVDEDFVAQMLDDMEIQECSVCGWWSHSGEHYLGHVEDCEGHEEVVCGNCCEDMNYD